MGDNSPTQLVLINNSDTEGKMRINKQLKRSRRRFYSRSTHHQRHLLAILLVFGLVTTGWHIFQPRKVGAVASLGLVISEVYGGAGCGTAGCSTYQNDFIELFNRSNTTVTCTGCSVQYAAATGTAWQVTALPAVLTLQPGQYYLVAESFGANGVSPLPTPDTSGIIAMSATAAKIAIVNSTVALTGACPSLAGPGSTILDFVGYGATANCSETAVAPAPSTTTSDNRAGAGNVDTDNNSTDFSTAAPNPKNTLSAFGTPTAANGAVKGTISDNTGTPVAGTVVNLNGSQNRKTITNAKGYYQFDNVETNGFYTVTPSRANYSFGPATRSFSLIGNQTDATFTGSAVGDNLNPLDTPEYFVRQQYLDVLGREPDEGGFNYWSDEILHCGADPTCVDQRRRAVAASFFMAEEFQDTGSYIYDMYQGTLGRKPVYSEYMVDRRQVIGGPSLATQKAAFADGFVGLTEFVQKYQGNTTAESFVDALLQNVQQSSQLDLSSRRSALINQYNAGAGMTQSRSLVLRALADDAVLKQAEYNAAFVLTEYFGYLRRNPEPEGYTFWLNVLNHGDVGNYRGMVCSFITSTEYQQRFSSVVSHSNAECGN
jgi:hypothetical protein